MRTCGLIVCVCSLAVALGCGGDGEGPSPDTAASLTAEGWDLFEQGLYEDAKDKFNDALSLDDTYADAYNGLGWSNAKLDLLEESLAGFAACITYGMTTADPYAGRTPVYRDCDTDPNHFDDAIASGEAALDKDRRYVFSHDTSFDWKDLMLILAQSYCGIGDFEIANAWVDSLPDGVPLNPESPTFEEDLLDHIEDLGDIYGG